MKNPIYDTPPYPAYFAFKKSPETKKGYACDFYIFKRIMGKWPHEVGEKELFEFFDKRRNGCEGWPAVSDGSLSRFKGGLSAFYKWLQATHFRPDNPGTCLMLIDIDPRSAKPKALTMPQQEKLYSVLRWNDSIHDNQVSVFIMVGIKTGLRLSELMRLKWEDINLETGRIKSIRKGAKLWTGRIPGPLVLVLKAYKLFLEGKGIDSPWLFFNNEDPSKHLSKSALGHWFIALKKRCEFGPEVKFSPHVLRHCLCTLLANSGVPDHIAIKITGHAGVDVYKKNYVKVEDQQTEDESIRVLG